MTRHLTNVYVRLSASVRRYLDGETGASMVEYALLVSLIALAAFAAVTIFGSALSDKFGDIGTSVTNT